MILRSFVKEININQLKLNLRASVSITPQDGVIMLLVDLQQQSDFRINVNFLHLLTGFISKVLY